MRKLGMLVLLLGCCALVIPGCSGGEESPGDALKGAADTAKEKAADTKKAADDAAADAAKTATTQPKD